MSALASLRERSAVCAVSFGSLPSARGPPLGRWRRSGTRSNRCRAPRTARCRRSVRGNGLGIARPTRLVSRRRRRCRSKPVRCRRRRRRHLAGVVVGRVAAARRRSRRACSRRRRGLGVGAVLGLGPVVVDLGRVDGWPDWWQSRMRRSSCSRRGSRWPRAPAPPAIKKAARTIARTAKRFTMVTSLCSLVVCRESRSLSAVIESPPLAERIDCSNSPCEARATQGGIRTGSGERGDSGEARPRMRGRRAARAAMAWPKRRCVDESVSPCPFRCLGHEPRGVSKVCDGIHDLVCVSNRKEMLRGGCAAELRWRRGPFGRHSRASRLGLSSAGRLPPARRLPRPVVAVTGHAVAGPSAVVGRRGRSRCTAGCRGWRGRRRPQPTARCFASGHRGVKSLTDRRLFRSHYTSEPKALRLWHS